MERAEHKSTFNRTALALTLSEIPFCLSTILPTSCLERLCPVFSISNIRQLPDVEAFFHSILIELDSIVKHLNED